MQSTKFLQAFGSKLAEQWVATLLTPAFLFWGGGLLAWIDKFGWNDIRTKIGQLYEPLQIAVLIATLLVVTISAFVVKRFDLIVLRLLEGYWPRWMRPLRRLFIRFRLRQISSYKARLNKLWTKQETEVLTIDESEDLAHLEWILRFMSTQPEQLMPTQLGNILLAAEIRPKEKYGLDSIICWPHLWLLMPDNTRNELKNARANLDNVVRVLLWSILFLVWTPLAFWALPIGLLIAFFAYSWMLETARSFSMLVEAAFDLHRSMLYQSLHWPLPINSDEERKMGQHLTECLWRGPVRGSREFSYTK